MKILVVDDNDTNRKLLRVTLEAEGFDIIEASDGVEALQVLERDQPDLIISDILMPNMDGYRFCHEVRNRQQFQTIPFIVHSSTYDSMQDEKLALRFGADKFVRRPSPARELLGAIREAAAKTQREATSPQVPEELEVLKAYSEQLVKKLEARNAEIEQAHAKILEVHEFLLRRTEQLEASEEKFRGIFENALDIFYRTDMKGTVQLISPSIQRLGYLPEELDAIPIGLLFADTTDLDQKMLTVTQGGIIEDQEVTLKHKDGEPFVASLSARLITNIRGRPIGVEGIFRDINERKRLEAQLLQAQKLESVGRLAGGIAHDFNNLLTIIMGCTEFAADALPEDHPAHHYMNEVLSATTRAGRLTHQLLTFARRQVSQPRVTNLSDLILQTGEMLRRLIGEDITLVTLPRPDVGQVKVDLGQMEQVLVNLVVNARDAMPSGGKLTIETANVTLDEEYARHHVGVVPGDYVMLAVSDTGTGMDAATQAHVFEPFFTTKEPGKGTGLGLATCYGIIKQSKGHIWLYSEPGKGTAFKIYLPRVEEIATVLPEREASGSLPRGNETVMVVEDDEALRAITMQVLGAQGYTVLGAADGEEALRLIGKHPGELHLLMTDVIMPKMGGKALAEQLLAVYPDVKVLYTSGYTETAIVHHEALDSHIAFLQKPFTPAVLARKVRVVLDTGSQSRSGNG